LRLADHIPTSRMLRPYAGRSGCPELGADVWAGLNLGDREAGAVAEEEEGVDGVDGAGAVDVALEFAVLVVVDADIGAGRRLGLGVGEAGVGAEDFKGVDGVDAAGAVDITPRVGAGDRRR